MDISETVLVDCNDQDIKGKELSFEHARRLFNLQHTQGRNDWTLSDGQNFELKNGNLIKQRDSSNTSKKDEARRTRELPNS